MSLRSPLNFIGKFFLENFKNIKNFYLNSSYYDKKISKTKNLKLFYKPSPHLLSSLIQYQKKKINVDEIKIDNIWRNKNPKIKNFNKLNNFYWFFSLDLRSSKNKTKKIISDWINENYKYNSKCWEFDLTSKRIISWLSNHNLTVDKLDTEYQNLFDKIILKQTNHLINELNNSKTFDDKIIGCAAIILVGLSYKEEKNYLSFGLDLLKRISNQTLDDFGFPKSRNINQLVFYLKYYILIREWFREAMIQVPDHVDETIYFLGQGYAFLWQNIKFNVLMNGNNISNNSEFDQYLKRFSYVFKNENIEFGGYAVLRNKKISIIMDVGNSPPSKFSSKYQSGALSFEINSNGKKLISNCGYYDGKNTRLIELSKSTATHSTLIIDDTSSCKFKKSGKEYSVKHGLKILNKNFIFKKSYWKLNASHDGYLNKYYITHEREIEFFPEQLKFIGKDKIISKKSNPKIKFDIRFHVEPNIKLMKTQDNKTILIELEDEGWKFSCNNFDINIDNGLYFGNKNSYNRNQNIFISGITNYNNQDVSWELSQI